MDRELKDKKLLFVEDDMFVGNMLTKRLQVAGAEVTTATNGEEGLEALEKGTFDALITDLMMPRMNGYEMLKKVQENDKTKDIPVLVLTNHRSLTDETKRVAELNIGGFYIKSNTDLREIVKQVARIIEEKETKDAGKVEKPENEDEGTGQN